jgi:DNA topoisomerase-3
MKLTLRLLLNEIAMRILNVAEKNDAAKTIASIAGKGRSQMRDGLSKFNKIYEFDYQLFNNQQCKMVMTSVSGHLLNFDFVQQFRSWQSCDPVELFNAKVQKQCPEAYDKIRQTLQREIRSCQKLIIWTDCDREGENIGYEIIQVCKEVKPNIDIWRARFSEMTPAAIRRALSSLERPNQNVSDAVDARMELDLRIGAAFTRFQTLRIQKAFAGVLSENLVSYGSCQFPTLGFVVERFKDRENFVSEPFWKIQVTHKMENQNAPASTVDFNWERVRLFDYNVCIAFYNLIKSNPQAKVVDITTKPKNKWRPTPLDTIVRIFLLFFFRKFRKF